VDDLLLESDDHVAVDSTTTLINIIPAHLPFKIFVLAFFVVVVVTGNTRQIITQIIQPLPFIALLPLFGLHYFPSAYSNCLVKLSFFGVSNVCFKVLV